MKRKQGFTLLELLMVVIIIAILAAIALPQYIRATEKARAASPLNYLGALRSAEVRYRAQSAANVYTTVLADLDVELPATIANWTGAVITVAAGPPAAGKAVFTRAAGQFIGQTVGISYGSGTVCGNFLPLKLAVALCVAD